MPYFLRDILRHFVLFIIFVAVQSPLDVCAQVNTDLVTNLGKNALYSEDYFLSIQYLNQVIIQKPYLAKPYYYRGVAKVSLGDLMGGEVDLSKCVDINPFVEDAFRIRAVARHKVGKLDDALADYNKYLDFYPGDKDVSINKAMCLIAMGDFQEAGKILYEILASGGNNEKACLAMAVNLLSQRDSIGAIDYLSRALILDNSNVKAHLLRCELNCKTVADIDQALADMDAVINQEPNSAFHYFNRSILHYKNGELRSAMADLDYAIALNPSNLTARLGRALLRAEVGDKEGARADYVFISAHGQEVFSSSFSRFADMPMLAVDNDVTGLIMIDSEHLMGGKSRYRTYYGTQKNVSIDGMLLEPEGLFMLSYYYNDNSPHSHSYFFEELTQVNDLHVLPSPLTLINKMPKLSAYDASDRFNSVEKYNTLISVEHQESQVNFFGRAMDFFLLRNVDAAIADADRTIALSPDFSIAYFLRFNAKWMKLEMEQNSRAGNDDDDSSMSHTLSLMHFKSSIDNMLNDIKTAAKLSPSNAYAFYNIAYIQALLEDYHNAIDNYSHAIELRPDLGEAFFNRGLIYIHQGDNKKAAADLSKAGELGIVASYNILKKMATQ